MLFQVLSTLFFITVLITNPCPLINTTDIDLNEFVKHTWYSQMQQEVEYQKKNSFYCVAATYNIEINRTVPLFHGNVISVYNYANIDKVNGDNFNNGTILCARQVYNTSSSKLRVGLCNLPNLFTGPYWIIDRDLNYEWIVVSGGQPKNKYQTGCTTNINTTNNAGLWIFSRTPILKKTQLDIAINNLKHKGYTTSFLYKVKQKGCKYNGAFIK